MRGHCDMGELVSAVLDGEATDLERAAVRRHLRYCATCRDFSAFSQAMRVRACEGLGSAADSSPVVGECQDLFAARLAAEVRRGRGGQAAWRAAATLMAVLVLGVTLGAAGTQMLAGRGLPEAVAPAYETRLTLSRPLSRDFVRLMETAPRAQVAQRDIAGTAEWDEPFAELVPLEDYPSDPKLVRLVMTP